MSRRRSSTDFGDAVMATTGSFPDCHRAMRNESRRSVSKKTATVGLRCVRIKPVGDEIVFVLLLGVFACFLCPALRVEAAVHQSGSGASQHPGAMTVAAVREPSSVASSRSSIAVRSHPTTDQHSGDVINGVRCRVRCLSLLQVNKQTRTHGVILCREKSVSCVSSVIQYMH